MIVLLDLQHRGRRSRPADLGAEFDVDGDGRVESDEREANLTPIYALACADALGLVGGIEVLLLAAGEYAERQAVAVALAANRPSERIAYVACHLNAGGGSYGLVIHDSRSSGGRQLAEAVAVALKLPELDKVVVGTTDEFPRAAGTIGGVFSGPPNISGVCFEPFFLDQPRHSSRGAVKPAALSEPDGLRRVGAALAVGLLTWGGK